MKVFISWSGENSASHKVALALRDWLSDVFDNLVEPFVSSADIQKGERGLAKIKKELKDCDFGIICVTKDNREKPWLLFEAGALSNNFDEERVMPFLFGLKPYDLLGNPISQFQATEYPNDEEVKKLIVSINNILGEKKVSEKFLDRSFESCYPNLKKELSAIEPEESKPEPAPKDKSVDNTVINNSILDEILKISQSNQRLLLNSNENTKSLIKDITTENAKRFSVDVDEIEVERRRESYFIIVYSGRDSLKIPIRVYANDIAVKVLEAISDKVGLDFVGLGETWNLVNVGSREVLPIGVDLVFGSAKNVFEKGSHWEILLSPQTPDETPAPEDNKQTVKL